MRPRVPANRRGKNPSVVPPAPPVQRSQSEEASSPFTTMTNISSGYTGLAARVLPLMPMDGPLAFEIVMFAFISVSLLLQYLHLYRSVWWLPHSYNNNTVNFYLIDPILIVFSICILSRRVIWTLIKKLIGKIVPSNWAQSCIIITRSLLTFNIIVGLLYTAYVIVQKHHLVNILYLAYPVSLYFVLFGLVGEPFLELLPDLSDTNANSRVKIFQDSNGVYHCSTYMSNYANPMPINPETVRLEVQALKSDFNSRLKQIMFNAIVSTYYATFIPCVFVPNALSYETPWVFRHGVLVLFGSGALYTIQIFPSTYIHMLHRTAVKLGQWTKIEGRVSHAFYSQWSSNTVWPINSFVRHGKDLYKSEGAHNCAEPGNATQSRFYSLFCDPLSVIGVLLMVHTGLVLAQHMSLAWSTQWYQLISEAILLFTNYYSLFKIVRDYIVFSRLSYTDKEGKEN